jgi:hypothetical protein
MMGCSCSRCFILGRFLFARFDGQVMPDGATGNGAEYRMMMREMARHSADHRAFETPRLGRSNRTGKQESGKTSSNQASHLILRSTRNRS